jgi:LysM repeat protein
VPFRTIQLLKGIKYKSVLLIPISDSKLKTPTILWFTFKKHTVLDKQTLYGIAKQYGVTVDELQKLINWKIGTKLD